jgi:hypothetical protein
MCRANDTCPPQAAWSSSSTRPQTAPIPGEIVLPPAGHGGELGRANLIFGWWEHGLAAHLAELKEGIRDARSKLLQELTMRRLIDGNDEVTDPEWVERLDRY